MAADEIDCGGDDWYNEFYDAFDDVDIFTFDDGDLTAEQTGNGEAYKIEMDGDLHEDDGDDGGDIVFKGKFTKCEVEYEGAIYLYGFGGVGSSYYSSYSSSYSSYSDYSYR